MKITRAMIQKIIREEAKKDESPEHPADVEAVEDAWGGGDNLAHDIDYTKSATGNSNVAEPEKLEDVVREVRRRLKEELSLEDVIEDIFPADDHDHDEAARDLGYGEGEGRMTKSQLDKLARYSQSLHDQLMDDDDLPEWVQSKVAVAAENIGKVYHYLDYKMKRMEEESDT